MKVQNDYYKILGISQEASTDQIKKAYRKLAHTYHPDRNSDPDAEIKFKKISEAYEILSDPEKKQKYDTFCNLKHGFQSNPFDIFKDFFGGNINSHGNHVTINVTVSLEEVLTGVNRKLTYIRNFQCKNCKGTGGTGNICKTCNGSGQIFQRSGFIQTIQTCQMCKGYGIKITSKCSICNGSGQIKNKNTITTKIPPGIESGNHIRISGAGDISDYRMPPGDLLCRITVKPHPVFQRDKQHLFYLHEITFTEACLGTNISVPTLNGKNYNLKIPPGTQFGQIFKLKKMGLPTINNSRRGDLNVNIKINVPINLKKNEKNLLIRFDDAINEHNT